MKMGSVFGIFLVIMDIRTTVFFFLMDIPTKILSTVSHDFKP